MSFIFEKLRVYQFSQDLANEITDVTEYFPKGKYYLKDQLNRAIMSIPNNIAEGNGRFNKGERKQFFYIARGSAYECISLLDMTKKKGLISESKYNEYKKRQDEICCMLKGLINGMKKIFFIVIILLLCGKYMYADCIQNNFLGANVGIGSGLLYGFDLGIYSSYSPANGRLIYLYYSACFSPRSTSYIVAKIDDIPYNFYSSTLLNEAYTNTSDEMWGTHRFNNVVDIETHFKFVNNPSTGINTDTLQYKFIARNIDSITHNVALRLELDTMVLDNDGT